MLSHLTPHAILSKQNRIVGKILEVFIIGNLCVFSHNEIGNNSLPAISFGNENGFEDSGLFEVHSDVCNNGSELPICLKEHLLISQGRIPEGLAIVKYAYGICTKLECGGKLIAVAIIIPIVSVDIPKAYAFLICRAKV